MMNDAVMAQQRLMRAIQNYQSGDLTTAEKELNDLKDKFPKSDQIHSLLGSVHYAQKRYKDAFRAYQEALKINPYNEDALINIGTVEKTRGRPDVALKLLKEAETKLPKHALLQYNLGSFYIDIDDLENAEPHLLKSLQLDPRLFEAHVQLADIYKDWERYADSEKYMRNAMAIHPVPLLEEKLKTLLELQGKTGAVEPVEVVAEKPQEGQTMPETSTDTAESALGADMDDPEDLVKLGVTFFERQRYPDAEEYFEKALQIDAEHKGAQHWMRRIMSLKIPQWHFEMLADTARNEAYEKAIEAVMAEKPGARVLDIGTGSGLLSMMAARAGASEVVTCEMNEDLAKVAKQIIKANGFEDKITVLSKKSTDLTEKDYGKFDVIISEILDSVGLGEDAVPTLRHAKETLMKPNGIMLPEAMKLYVQLIEIPSLYMISPIKEVSGFDLSAFDQFRPLDDYKQITLKHEEYTSLSAPFELKAYDFTNLPASVDVNNPVREKFKIKIQESGKIQAIAVWFDLQLTDEVSGSSGPDGEFVHWQQAIHFFPEETEVKASEEVEIMGLFSDSLVRFEL